jgi:hypothetical protein
MQFNSFTGRDKPLLWIAQDDLKKNDRGIRQFYDSEGADRLYTRCSKLILDCVDWSDMKLEFSDVTHAYDILHELYCAQLSTNGLPFE